MCYACHHCFIMRARFIVSLLFTLPSFWLAGCAIPPATVKVGQLGRDQITAVKGMFPVLEKGMTSEVLRQKLGPPAEITPMESPGGKAEVWVYHFEESAGMSQVATGVRMVPTFSMGLGGPITVMTTESVFTMVEKKSVVTLSLLLFNDRLEAQKAKVETVSDYK